MSSPSVVEQFRPRSVPIVLLAIVAITALVVPPLALGEVSGRTYALTAAVFILAIGAALPYTLLVAVGTLPLLYAGVASYAAPQPSSEPPHSFSLATGLRHVIAGLSYALGAAAVGAVGVGAQMALPSESTAVPAAFQPSFLVLGGVLVGGTFIGLQLWRYDASSNGLDRRTVLGTAVLGALLAFSPVVAFWVFSNA